MAFVVAPYEADAQMAHLALTGAVWAVVGRGGVGKAGWLGVREQGEPRAAARAATGTPYPPPDRANPPPGTPTPTPTPRPLPLPAAT